MLSDAYSSLTDFWQAIGQPVPPVLQRGAWPARSPIDGAMLAHVKTHSVSDVSVMIDAAQHAFATWRDVPMPVRGRLIGVFGNVLHEHKEALAAIVTREAGKIVSEARGEVQEMVDIAEYAVGLSRQIGGQVFPSELPNHILQERWQPKGIVGIISAFNFPVAVWSWNLALSVVCGNANIWKPSEKTFLSAVAAHALWDVAVKRFEQESGVSVPAGVSQLLLGDRAVGEALVADARVALVSATGSSAMGLKVQAEVAKTLGRTVLLELGGNNAVVITPSAPMPLTLQSTLFGAIGTAGQRCTTTRRLLVQRDMLPKLWSHLEQAYRGLDVAKIGDPRKPDTLIGPLIDKAAFDAMQDALHQARAQGGTVTGGERVHAEIYPDAYYVRPAIVTMPGQTAIVRHEVFAPILYVMAYDTLDDAIAMNNDVPQGLSSAIFTRDLQEAETFLRYSDCGIINVNNGTSGAEIGGAFGGNKETGGGRESGSDAWKQYMTRATSRINAVPTALALAQGVQFPIPLDQDALRKDFAP